MRSKCSRRSAIKSLFGLVTNAPLRAQRGRDDSVTNLAGAEHSAVIVGHVPARIRVESRITVYHVPIQIPAARKFEGRVPMTIRLFVHWVGSRRAFFGRPDDKQDLM